MDHRASTSIDSLSAMLELHDDPAVLIDEQYTIVAANQAYINRYGQPGLSVTGRKCHAVSHRSPVPCHQRGEDCPVKHVMSTGQPVDTMHIHFNSQGAPETVRVRGCAVDHQGRRLLAEKIQILGTAESDPPPLPDSTNVQTHRRWLLAKSLHKHNGNRARAAAELGVSERTVYRWMKCLCDETPAIRASSANNRSSS